MLTDTSITELHRKLTDHVALSDHFIAYLQNELHLFQSLLADEKLSQIFRPRLDTIEYILFDRKLHSQALIELLERMLELEGLIEQKNNEGRKVLLVRWQEYKEDFNQLMQHEYWNIQPRLDTRLELAIRTLSAEFSLMERLLNKNSLTEISPSTALTSSKMPRPIVPRTDLPNYKDIAVIQQNLNAFRRTIDATQATEGDFMQKETVSR